MKESQVKQKTKPKTKKKQKQKQKLKGKRKKRGSDTWRKNEVVFDTFIYIIKIKIRMVVCVRKMGNLRSRILKTNVLRSY